MKSASVPLTYPCVVFALRRESMFFRRAFPLQRHIPNAPCIAQIRGMSSHTIVLLETGVGSLAMERAMRWCLSGLSFGTHSYRPGFVLSLGFSGALAPDLRIGDLVLATEIIDLQGQRWETVCPQRTEWCQAVHKGRLLMTTELVCEAQEKIRLGKQFHATAVDMESGVIARHCADHGVPFACVRVISDDVRTPLSSHLVDLLRGVRVSPLRLTNCLLCHPGLIVELCQLAKKTRLAARKLLEVAPILLSLSQLAH